jgi:hypothetical protein
MVLAYILLNYFLFRQIFEKLFITCVEISLTKGRVEFLMLYREGACWEAQS